MSGGISLHKIYKLFIGVVLNAQDAILSASVVIVSRNLRFVSLAELYTMAALIKY